MTPVTVIVQTVAVAGIGLSLAAPAHAQSKAPDLLGQARASYNDQEYDRAIELSNQALAISELRHAASVVRARAHLERFRQSSMAADLDAARDAMKTIDASALGPRDRVDLLIALGTSLYLDESYSFDDRFSAAAEQFELALAQADMLDERSRDQLFDWWAGSLDRQAQQGSDAGRRALYERILQRAEEELARNGYSAAASYWIAAAARGVNDLPRAMGAAVAAWVRAAALGPRGDAVRLDLDRLMRQVIMPERAREMVPGGDAHPALALLEAQWTQVQEKWQ